MPDVLSKSLWRAYFFILAASLLLLVIGCFYIWNLILAEERIKLSYSNRLVSNSMRSLLQKDEALFRVTGERLQEIGLFDNQQQSQQLINNLLSKNPELAGIGIVNPQGQLLLSTSNIDPKNIPNLLKTKETAESFKKVLSSDSLMIGKTYYLAEIQDWIVPIRYRIVDDNNKVVAVLATGLRLQSKYSPWQSHVAQGDLQLAIINADFYFVFSTLFKSDEARIAYSRPIDKDYLQLFSEHLLKKTGLKFEDFFNGYSKITTLIYPKPSGGNSIAAFSYDQRYSLFTFNFRSVESLYAKLLMPVTWLFILLTAFNIILFFLFKFHSQLQKQAKEKLEYQAQHDQLTCLPNMRFLNHHFLKWKKDKKLKTYAVLFMDLDDFKNSNDLHGHKIGDKILIEVSQRIKSDFADGLCIRQGGDEFIIILPYTDNIAIKKRCQEFLRNLKKPILIEKLKFQIRASIGITIYPSDGKNMETLLSKADIAMYDAKQNNQGIKLFSKQLDIHNSRLSNIVKELNDAVEKKEFSMVYQPQICSKTQTVIGAEALLRWNNSILGEVSPAEFIPIAERTGAIIEIGRYVIETALSEFYNVSQVSAGTKQNTKFRLSINVSIRQLANASFVEMLFELISQYNCKNTKLMLEVTETLTIERFEEIGFALEKIQLAGIEVSLDDFGTGFSSLSYLSRLPINEIKIDKSFVNGVEHKKQDKLLVKSIINLGHSLGVNVLAEGVENIQQVEILERYGCSLFQGYYYSDALSADQLAEYFKQNS